MGEREGGEGEGQKPEAGKQNPGFHARGYKDKKRPE